MKDPFRTSYICEKDRFVLSLLPRAFGIHVLQHALAVPLEALGQGLLGAGVVIVVQEGDVRPTQRHLPKRTLLEDGYDVAPKPQTVQETKEFGCNSSSSLRNRK